MQNNFVRLCCDSCQIFKNIAACIFLKENLSELVSFCVAILILKLEVKQKYFWHIMLFYFREGKNATEMQKKFKNDLCNV